MDKRHIEAASLNKRAWEYRVYEWRVRTQGKADEFGAAIKKNPLQFLRWHARYFKNIEGKKIASVCGSDGRCAVALASLGADVTVFDQSEPQKRYALEVAAGAGVTIKYVVGDFCKLAEIFAGQFDYAYCESGILHYFLDLQDFCNCLRLLLKEDGILVLSDYHPYHKILRQPGKNVSVTDGDYFDKRVHYGHLPYMKYFNKEEQGEFPPCQLRFYTISEIINAVIKSHLCIEEMQEHPKHNNEKFPGEFTIIAKCLTTDSYVKKY